MAVFTVVTEADLSAWMRHYDLGDVVDFRGQRGAVESGHEKLSDLMAKMTRRHGAGGNAARQL